MHFKDQILQGIPSEFPARKPMDSSISHAPIRRMVLSPSEQKLAVRNALRYFPDAWHEVLAREFYEELHQYGRIYMYRFRPDYAMYARSIDEYPAQNAQAAAIMLMIQNNLDPAVAQHPHELITYGGNGSVFQNWAQYLVAMRYLALLSSEQTLHIYSGHPMGIFPSHPGAPRLVVTNGMMIPNYSSVDDWDKYNALGVTQYGQMTAGSYMYIGPQGIVHGTTITIMNAFRKMGFSRSAGQVFLTSGLGGMSGAQPKAGNISGCITVCAEINPMAALKRHEQGWVDEYSDSLEEVISRTKLAMAQKLPRSIAYIGNVVELWEAFWTAGIQVAIGSDQTSLHNPWSGGYYPVGKTLEESQKLMIEQPAEFRKAVQQSLIRQVKAINQHVSRGMYFFDYGNAFLLEAARAGAEVLSSSGSGFRYASYVQDIMGPMCFDFGFGPFRWVCTSGQPSDLQKTDAIALSVMRRLKRKAPKEVQQQYEDNIQWILQAGQNQLVVGSQARILYADAMGRIEIARAFNRAIASSEISAPVVLGRDHHDVSGTDSPYRETSNIYDGSQFTADMAIHNVIGDSFRGATWVSIHNGGGVGWGEVINGGFGLLLDGSRKSRERLQSMLYFDVNNGIARRAWARNPAALQTIRNEVSRAKGLEVTLASIVSDDLLDFIRS